MGPVHYDSDDMQVYSWNAAAIGLLVLTIVACLFLALRPLHAPTSSNDSFYSPPHLFTPRVDDVAP